MLVIGPTGIRRGQSTEADRSRRNGMGTSKLEGRMPSISSGTPPCSEQCSINVDEVGRRVSACQRRASQAFATAEDGRATNATEATLGPPNLAMGKRILLVVARGRRGVRGWACALLCRVQSAECCRLIGAGRCTYGVCVCR
jgi:hypothetical protein